MQVHKFKFELVEIKVDGRFSTNLAQLDMTDSFT